MTQRIHLVRHGKPDFWALHDFKRSVTGRELGELWQEYAESGTLSDSAPSAELLSHSQFVPQIYSSDIQRALESAQRLPYSGTLHTDPLFREAGIPHGFWLTIALPLWAWIAITRIFWLFGYSRNCESFSAFRRRAYSAADLLCEKAYVHDEVMLVAHGWVNAVIFYHLRRKGWRADGAFQRQYWGWNVLSSPLAFSRCAPADGLEPATGSLKA